MSRNEERSAKVGCLPLGKMILNNVVFIWGSVKIGCSNCGCQFNSQVKAERHLGGPCEISDLVKFKLKHETKIDGANFLEEDDCLNVEKTREQIENVEGWTDNFL